MLWLISHLYFTARSRSPSPSRRKQRDDSPTSATHPDKGKKATVADLTKDKKSLRIHVSIVLFGLLDKNVMCFKV